MIYTDEQLTKLHEILLMMMDEIKRVCEKNGIKYFCMYGSLIGAVRHKGFIPWDDDFDIVMLREDYDRFMDIAAKELRSDMFVENYNNYSGYGHVFGKVVLKNTVFEENFTENVDCAKGVYVDVFPIDRTTSNKLKHSLQYYKCKLIARMMLLNCKYKYTKTGLKKIAYKFGYWISSLFSKETLVKMWEKNAFKYNKCKDGIYYIFAGGYSLGKEQIPEAELSKAIAASFDGHEYAIPEKYDSILRRCYGDYMQLPPVEKRIAHHNIVNIDFGDY